MAATVWVGDRAKQAIDLCEAGLSMREIAEKIGGVTRNSVIGFLHRQGIYTKPVALSQKADRDNRPVKLARKITMAARVKKAEPKKPNFDAVPFERRGDLEALAEPKHIQLEDLRLGLCKWPYGDGPFTFCGCETRITSPYCDVHSAIAHAPRRKESKGRE